MSETPNLPSAEQAKFQSLLRELFQFDCADLDFGIYRIMNHKRRVLDAYIDRQLPRAIEEAVGQGAIHTEAERADKFRETREKAIQAFGEDAIAPNGELIKYQETPLGREYVMWRKRARHSEPVGDVRRDIYNHLYSFFSRYYHDGDFVPKRRYSWEHPYVIPYNGEEVHFHWANRDQYYVKAAEHFRDYRFRTLTGVSVRFFVRSANVEQNDVTGQKRFFFPMPQSAVWNEDSHALELPFEYRPLTSSEAKVFGSTGQQEAIIDQAEARVPDVLATVPEAAKALLNRRNRAAGEKNTHTLFNYHAQQFTRRRTSDFFIHRDLKGFLTRELEYYLRSEVLRLSSLVAGGEARADAWFDKMRIIREVGRNVIEFLGQIEGFQKMLWEKRKFVLDAQYCVAAGLVPEKLVPRVLECRAQWDEWRALGCIGDEDTLFCGGDDPESRSEFLKRNPGILLDTRHFRSSFVDEMLATIDEIDKKTDGLAIRSENWQALNLLEERFRQRLSCSYIDPPYNTAASAILYKNDYKDSSWLALMENRLRKVPSLLIEGGILCIAIDDVEYANLQALLSAMFGGQSLLATAIVRSNPAGRSTPTGFSSSHEYALFVGRDSHARVGRLPRSIGQIKRYNLEDKDGRFQWVGFRKHGGMNAYRKARPRLYYPLFVTDDGSVRVPRMTWMDLKKKWHVDELARKAETVVWPNRENGEEMTWKWQAQRVEMDLDKLRGKKLRSGKMNVYVKSHMKEGTLPTTWWDKREYSASEHGTRNLKSLFGHARGFSFPKSIHLVEDCIRASGCTADSMVLDYFAGSGTTGHAVINLNREDGGRRKFILVEMGDHFETVLLPRLKKVAFSPEWKSGTAKRGATTEEAERGPRIIKYFRMEGYEDTLGNIEFEDENESLFALEDYMLRYMLQWETKRSATLLNVAALDRPFDYRLKLNFGGGGGGVEEMSVDLPETFNYLLGLAVSRRRTFDDDGRRYLVYTGSTRDGHTAVVIWRNTNGWTLEDRERDRKFVAANGMTSNVDEIWMNGDTMVKEAQSLDALFKRRMFESKDN